MTKFIASIAVILTVIAALIFTIKKRKRMEHSVFLFLLTFEILALLAAGWVFVIYGAIIEMDNII